MSKFGRPRVALLGRSRNSEMHGAGARRTSRSVPVGVAIRITSAIRSRACARHTHACPLYCLQVRTGARCARRAAPMPKETKE